MDIRSFYTVKSKKVWKEPKTIKVVFTYKKEPPIRVVPKNTTHTSGKWVVEGIYEYLCCDICDGLRETMSSWRCRCV